MATRTRKKSAPRTTMSPDDMWIIDGTIYYRRDLPPGVDHPVPGRDECPIVDISVLKSIRTEHTTPAFPDGIPPEAVMTYTSTGLVLKQMVRLAEEIEVKVKGKKKPQKRTVYRGALQKIYYRAVSTGDDPRRVGLTVRIPGPKLPHPLWNDPSHTAGVPVGREPEFTDRFFRNWEME